MTIVVGSRVSIINRCLVIIIEINIMKTLEQDLIMNRFPFPQFYDGHQFNTIISNKRKSVPIYLRKELPSLKYLRLKQKFNSVNQVQAPSLSFFNNMIQKPKEKPKPKPGKSYRERCHDKKERELKKIRQELQFALIMTDLNSQIIVGLLQKASKIQDQALKKDEKWTERSFDIALMKSKNNQSLDLRRKQKKSQCFPDTSRIAFSLKKKRLLQNKAATNPEPIQQRIGKSEKTMSLFSLQ